jgi:hypothetical protein
MEYLSRLLVSVKPVDPARPPSIAQPPEPMPRDPLAWLPLLRHWTYGLGEGPAAPAGWMCSAACATTRREPFSS